MQENSGRGDIEEGCTYAGKYKLGGGGGGGGAEEYYI